MTIQTCKRCPELAGSRTHIVIGSGPIPAPIVFLGDAPGKIEDKKGTPFCGTSGKYLRILIKKIGIPSKDYYLLNCIKCYPPDNRDPLKEELINCLPFLKRQLNVLKPKLIVAMGKYAYSFCLQENPDEQIRVSKRAGTFVEVPHTKIGLAQPVMALLTFHPTFVLRNNSPGIDNKFRRHLQLAKDFI